jgi:gluconolactonase
MKVIKYVLFLPLIFALIMSGCKEKNAESNENYELNKITSGLNFPEGPAWDGKSTLYVSNCNGSWITMVSGNQVDTLVDTPSAPVSFKQTNGLTVYQDGTIYACDFGLGAILTFDSSGECKLFLDGYQGKKFNRPNDLAFDQKGNLYFTDPKSYDVNNRDGVIYAYFRAEKLLKPVYSGLGFPNGLAFSPDGQYLYVCESALSRVLKFPIQSDGNLGDFSVFVEIAGGDPDGIAFDTRGNLYVAHFGTGAVYVVSPDQQIIRKIDLPGKKVTNVEFGDADMRTLYITEVETNALYKIRVEIPGLKLFLSPTL